MLSNMNTMENRILQRNIVKVREYKMFCVSSVNNLTRFSTIMEVLMQ